MVTPSTSCVSPGAAGIEKGKVDWGDADGDGDLDLLMTGSVQGEEQREPVTMLFENNSGSFSAVDTELTPVADSFIEWGDFDLDGDPDIALMGVDELFEEKTQIFRQKSDGSFEDIGASIPGLQEGEARWGDFDGDLDLDLLVTGTDEDNFPFTQLFENQGVYPQAVVNSLLGGESAGLAGDTNEDEALDAADIVTAVEQMAK